MRDTASLETEAGEQTTKQNNAQKVKGGRGRKQLQRGREATTPSALGGRGNIIFGRSDGKA